MSADIFGLLFRLHDLNSVAVVARERVHFDATKAVIDRVMAELLIHPLPPNKKPATLARDGS